MNFKEEAINRLKAMRNKPMYEAEAYCAECCYGLGDLIYPEPEDYAINEAIEALNKQIEKEATVCMRDVICPKCHSIAFEKDRIPKWMNQGYCWRCGQKMKWKTPDE